MDVSQPPVDDYIKKSVLVAQGDIVIRGAGEPERLGIGTVRQIVKVNAGVTALEYENLPNMFLKGRARKVAADQVYLTLTTADVIFENVDHDSSGMYDNINSRFTPLIAGYYLVKCRIHYVKPGAQNYFQLYTKVSGVIQDFAEVYDGDAFTNKRPVEINSLVYVNGSTDYIHITIYNNYSSPLTVKADSNGTSFQILGPF